tara:strand:+ start:10281 stop:10898 length:618 start_codon:yes stop_codon:yes gene_type:complete
VANFPRTVPSAHAAAPKVPTGLISPGRTGVSQLRSENRAGRTWTETWGAIKAGNASVEALLAFIEYYYNTLTIFDCDHPYAPGSGGAPNGAGGGTPLVNGASQTGASLITDGWPNSTLVVAAGDNLKVAGLNAVYKSRDDGTSDGSGNLTLTVNPPIASGNSPANNAALTLTGNRFRVFIADYEPGLADPGEYMVGMRVTFQETV